MLSRRRRAHNRMLGLICAYWKSQLVFVAAKLGIADAIANEPLTAEEIARRVGANAPHLVRVLRALASLGVFECDGRGRYRLNQLGQTLRTGQPDSLRSVALMLVEDYTWAAWGALGHSVTHGGSAFEHVHGLAPFPYLQQQPHKEQIFSQAMASLSALENAAVASALSFGRMQRLVDVGGAHGHLLATVLRRYPHLQGVLFDQSQVIAAARQAAFITAPELRARCESLGGDFFTAVPAGADAYIMKYVIHDWPDDQCVTILRNCRTAMANGGRVLVVEHVIAGRNRRDWAKLLDINMMVVPGGRERTRAEFNELFTRAGLKLQRVLRTGTPLRILEARAA